MFVYLIVEFIREMLKVLTQKILGKLLKQTSLAPQIV